MSKKVLFVILCAVLNKRMFSIPESVYSKI
jgi:hypothetical protein